MFGHIPELFIVLVIALIVFGPEKLPEMAANAGKMMREVRQAMDVAMNPQDVDVPDDFSTYYHDSLARSGEDVDDLDGDAGADEHDGGSDWRMERGVAASTVEMAEEEAEGSPS